MMAGSCIVVADRKTPVEDMEPHSEAPGRTGVAARIGVVAHKVVDGLLVAHRIGLKAAHHRCKVAGMPFCRLYFRP